MKKYSTKLNARCDKPSRECAKLFYKQFGITMLDGPKYAVDLVALEKVNGKPLACEVEQRLSWQGNKDKCSFSVFHILARKKKFFESGLVDSLTFNADFTWAFLIRGPRITRYLVKSVAKEVPDAEGGVIVDTVYEVPRHEVEFIDLAQPFSYFPKEDTAAKFFSF